MREARLAITMGDPAGVGPELCLRLFTPEAPTRLHNLTVFGSRDVLDRVARATGLPPIEQVEDLGPVENLQPGTVGAHHGRAAFDYVEGRSDFLSPRMDRVVDHFRFYKRFAFSRTRNPARWPLHALARWRVARHAYALPLERRVIERWWPTTELS